MRRTSILLVAFVLALASFLPAMAQNRLARLTINDTYLASQLLFSDGKGSYEDHRLTNGDPCVTAWVDKSGMFFIYMDYNADVGGDCNQNLLGNDPALVRTYVLKFPVASGICAALGLTADEFGICTLGGETSQRLRADKLFGRQQTTPVAVMSRRNGHSYSLEPNKEVAIRGTGDTRTLTYFDTATLKEVFQAPQRPRPVGSPFVFPFQLTVDRVPQ